MMIEVTKEQFYKIMGPLDVHPRVERDTTYWELRNRQLVGKTRGYMSEGPETYNVLKALGDSAK